MVEVEIAVKVFFFLLFIGICFWYFSSEKGTNTIIQNKITTMQTQIDNLDGRIKNYQELGRALEKRVDAWSDNQKTIALSNDERFMKVNEFCKEMNDSLGKFIQKTATDHSFRMEKINGILQADIDLIKGRCDKFLKDIKKHEHNINWLKNHKEPQIVEVSFVDSPKVSSSRKELKKIKEQVKELSQ